MSHTSHRQFIKPIVAMVWVSTLLSACATQPYDVKPDIQMPATFAHVSSTDESTLRLKTWWEQFSDPTLNTLIDCVLSGNLDLAAARTRMDQAQALAGSARADLMPSAQLSTQIASEHQSLESPLGKLASAHPGYNRDESLYRLGAEASWELDIFGGRHRALEAREAEAHVVEAEALGTRVSLVAEAADAYFQAGEAKARLKLLDAQVRTNAELLALVNLRLKEGLSTRGEQAEAAARLAEVKANIPLLHAEFERQLNRLDVLMGQQPGSSARHLLRLQVDDTRPDIKALPSPAILMRRRPDVLAAEHRLAAANAKIGEAISDYYPKFSLSTLLGFESLDTARPTSANFQPMALLGLRWRLFDFGRVDAEVAQAKGAAAEALIRYRQTLLVATEEVESALMTQIGFEDRGIELRKEVAAAAEARSAADDAYRGGASSLFEVLDQDRQLLSAKEQLVMADASNSRAIVAVYRALGGGW